MVNDLLLRYTELVDIRKQYKLPLESAFINQANFENGIFDKATLLDPLAHWHRKIPADILVIGQDWGGADYYKNNKGRDSDSNPTCLNLRELFMAVGIDTGSPSKPSPELLHFTNIIPFIRRGAMQGSLQPLITQDSINHFASTFTIPLIALVNPKIIITLGLAATKAVFFIYNINVSKGKQLKRIMELSPFSGINSPLIFPVYHCGSSTINRNRSLDEQKADWEKMLNYLQIT